MNLEMNMALELVKEAEGFYPKKYLCPTLTNCELFYGII